MPGLTTEQHTREPDDQPAEQLIPRGMKKPLRRAPPTR